MNIWFKSCLLNTFVLSLRSKETQKVHQRFRLLSRPESKKSGSEVADRPLRSPITLCFALFPPKMQGKTSLALVDKRGVFVGGSEGSRTPVRKPVCKTFYGRSRRTESFVTVRPSAGLRLRQPLDPTAGEAGCGWFPTLMTPVSRVVGNPGRTVAPVRQLQACNCCCHLYLMISRF